MGVSRSHKQTFGVTGYVNTQDSDGCFLLYFFVPAGVHIYYIETGYMFAGRAPRMPALL